MNIYVINPENNPKTNRSIIAEPIDTLEIYEIIKTKFNPIFYDLDINNDIKFNSNDLLIFIYDYILPLHTEDTLINIKNILSNYKIKNSIIISKQCLENEDKFFNLGFKYLVYINPEIMILDLIDAIINNKSLNNINNLIYKENNEIIKTKINKCKINYIIPNRNFNLNEYNDVRTMITSLGCDNNCYFCPTPYFQGKWTSRSIDSIIKEIEYLISIQTKKIMFLDDNFTTSKERVIKLCEAIKNKDIKCYFGCLSSINNYDKKMFEMMYTCGFRWVHFGIESGDSKILNSMNKKQDKENVIKVLNEVSDMGYKIRISLIIDYPKTDIESVNQTLDLIEKTMPNEIRLHYTAYRNFTPLYHTNNIQNKQYIHNNNATFEYKQIYIEQLKNMKYSIIDKQDYDWNKDSNNFVASFVPIKYGRNWIC